MEPEFVRVVLWALGTGGITGAVWAGVLLFRRSNRLAAEHRELLEDRQRTLDQVELLSNKIAELENRLDFTERVMTHPPTERELPPAAGTGGH